MAENKFLISFKRRGDSLVHFSVPGFIPIILLTIISHINNNKENIKILFMQHLIVNDYFWFRKYTIFLKSEKIEKYPKYLNIFVCVKLCMIIFQP